MRFYVVCGYFREDHVNAHFAVQFFMFRSFWLRHTGQELGCGSSDPSISWLKLLLPPLFAFRNQELSISTSIDQTHHNFIQIY